MTELLPEYQIMCWKLDACDFLGTSSRFRMHMTGVLKRCLKEASFEVWCKKLLACRRPRHDVEVDHCLLARDSPEVLAEESRLKKHGKKVGITVAETANQCLKRSRAAKWYKEHMGFRSHLASHGAVVPALSELPHAKAQGSALHGCGWARFYALREHDLLQLVEAEVQSRSQIDMRTAERQWFTDISEPLSHTRSLWPGIAPVNLRSHRLYWHQEGRHLLGLEQLFMLRFPRDLRREGISDPQLRLIAGNSRSIDVCCVEIALMLCFVDWECSPVEGSKTSVSSRNGEAKETAKRGLQPQVQLKTVEPHPHTSPSYRGRTALIARQKKKTTRVVMYGMLSPVDLPESRTPPALTPTAPTPEDSEFFQTAMQSLQEDGRWQMAPPARGVVGHSGDAGLCADYGVIQAVASGRVGWKSRGNQRSGLILAPTSSDEAALKRCKLLTSMFGSCLERWGMQSDDAFRGSFNALRLHLLKKNSAIVPIPLPGKGAVYISSQALSHDPCGFDDDVGKSSANSWSEAMASHVSNHSSTVWMCGVEAKGEVDQFCAQASDIGPFGHAVTGSTGHTIFLDAGKTISGGYWQITTRPLKLHFNNGWYIPMPPSQGCCLVVLAFAHELASKETVTETKYTYKVSQLKKAGFQVDLDGSPVETTHQGCSHPLEMEPAGNEGRRVRTRQEVAEPVLEFDAFRDTVLSIVADGSW